MLAIFLETLPFFGIIAMGYWAGRTRFLGEDATASLTKFVFFFALPAMLFRFAANLSMAEVFDLRFIAAYLCATFAVFLVAAAAARLRRRPLAEAAVEAQCATMGNVGFMGVPMLVMLLGEAAAGRVLTILALDLVVVTSLVTVLIAVSRHGRVSWQMLGNVTAGVVRNPMIAAMALGLVWSALALPVPGPANDLLALLGAAATPGALFAIGASLASKTAERLAVAGWLSFCKLALHPAAAALVALVLIPLDRFAAGVMIAAAALPVAGNVFIMAQHYGVAPQRVSASILISTTASVVTLMLVIAWVSAL